MKTAGVVVLRVIALTIILFICFAVAGGVVGLQGNTQTPEQTGAATLPLLAVCFLEVLVLAHLILRSRWTGWRLTAAVFFVFYGVATFMPQIESAVFLSRLPSGTVSRLFLMGALTAAPFSVLAVLILGRRKAETVVAGSNSRPVMQTSEWAWKLAVIALAYLILYFTFGYFIAWRNPAVLEYYGGTDPGSFFAQMGTVLRSTPWLIPFQIMRAMCWVALALPVIRMLKGEWPETALAIGLLFAVVMNAQLLLPNPYMPEPVRMAHLIETASSNFIFGLLIGWLLIGRRPSAALIARSRLVTLAIPLFWLTACSDKRDAALFKLLTPEQTGVTFANTITTNDSVNVQTDVYVYNGAGVAIGDIDNDGLSDLFFAGNMVSSRLYLNKGGMRFDDITESAAVTTNRWATGATMVDINNDGYLDIYVSMSGPERSKPADRANSLFINNRDRTFTEAAAGYGVADTGFTTHAVFLDYDGDKCLDLFVLNNSPTDFSRGAEASHPSGMRGQTPGSHNELYRNGCDGRFTNVSSQAGILRTPGYGLGVVVSDLNRDGWPDIYVSNDATPNDVVYVNNGDGTFTDKAGEWLKHASFAGMGVDIADFNNDGWVDILQVDMMPRTSSRRKRISGFMSYSRLLESRRRGFRDDYSANTLQLSNGVTKEGDVVFSEVARLAGVASTDWSWSALFADFDNDGYKDIFISNGYPKAVNDLDYQTAMFDIRRRGGSASRRSALDLLKTLHSYEEPNYFFRNAGDLTFTDQTGDWAVRDSSFSYGAAYGDLNNDGRLDLVVSNINAPASIYENIGPSDDAHHYLQIELQGDSSQASGIGSKLTLTAGGRRQYFEHTPYRGFMSTVDRRVHVGLGSARSVDSLEVLWPDGRHQVLTNVSVDTVVTVRQADATERKQLATAPPTVDHVFAATDGRRGLTYKHQPGTLVDYGVQPLLPYMISRQGPPIAAGDVDGDGLDDVFVGGGSGTPGQLFIQRKDGSFVASTGQPWAADKAYEDWGALFFDANGDKLPDLYVASGGYHLAPSSPLLQDRLYLNKGNGRFEKAAGALPNMPTSTATVRAGDFTGDGRADLFVGGRLTPRKYPYPTRSYLLRNDGGLFTDVTEQVAPELASPGGMITDAVWIDLNGDRRVDLVTVGEWMPIQFYQSDGVRLRHVNKATGLPPMRGWWYSLAAGDFNNDGRPDLVAGNLGLNHTYHTSGASRLGVYAGDFTGNQTTDIVLTEEIDGVEYPFAGRVPLGEEIYSLGLRFLTYGSFAQASVRQLFTPAQLQQAVHYQADTFASVYLQNNGDGTFNSSALPNLAQIAPVKAIVVDDVDGDGNLDAIVAGNLYDFEPNTPKADAGNGLWLRGDGKGRFSPVPPGKSGLLAPLNVAGLAVITTPTGKALLVTNTGDSLQTFAIRKR